MKLPSLFEQLRKAAARCCNRLGIKHQQIAKPSRHLEFSHPDMEAVRVFTKQCSDSHSIHPRLILNFDQVCSTHFEHCRNAVFKDPAKQGVRPNLASRSTNKLVEAVEEAMGRSVRGSLEHTEYVPKPPQVNADACMNPVDYFLNCRTTTTLSWVDGEMGCAFVTAASGALPMKLVESINHELKGDSWKNLGI